MGRDMTHVEQLSAFVSRVSSADLSPAAVEQLKIRVLDSLGCAIGAVGGEPVRLIRAHVEEFGGGARRAAPSGGGGGRGGRASTPRRRGRTRSPPACPRRWVWTWSVPPTPSPSAGPPSMRCASRAPGRSPTGRDSPPPTPPPPAP